MYGFPTKTFGDGKQKCVFIYVNFSPPVGFWSVGGRFPRGGGGAAPLESSPGGNIPELHPHIVVYLPGSSYYFETEI